MSRFLLAAAAVVVWDSWKTIASVHWPQLDFDPTPKCWSTPLHHATRTSQENTNIPGIPRSLVFPDTLHANCKDPWNIQIPGSRIPAPGSYLQHHGSFIPDGESWTSDPRSRILDPESRIQYAASVMQNTVRILDPIIQKHIVLEITMSSTTAILL